ncbi:MAG: hypothetical protein BGO98_24020 [Myxococcales bacterium 68-20]|nr:ATP synthase subunit I [Myxococcales bacterium]OJY15741.1 MAG: hypothetical protein BGO98_24020 [Myxococcales bacterium 68-20]
MSAPEPEPSDPNQSGGSSGHDEGPPEGDDAARSAMAAAIIGAGLTLGAFGLHGTRAAYSVLVGATIAVANLLTMRAIIRALIPAPDQPENAQGGIPDGETGEPEPPKTRGRGATGWALVAGLKILVLIGGLWFLLSRQLVDPMPLVVGYGVLPLGIAASAVWSSLRSGR